MIRFTPDVKRIDPDFFKHRLGSGLGIMIGNKKQGIGNREWGIGNWKVGIGNSELGIEG
jgi:hypothetical protein